MAGLGVLDAFNQARQQSQQEGMGQLAQAQGLMGILSQVAAQRKQEQALAQQQAYRGALAAATTPEEQQAVALRFGDPKDVLGHFDTRAKIDNTKQTAMMNLQQRISTEARHAYEFARTLPLKERAVALQEINSRAQNAYKAGSLAIQAGNLNYNTGADTGGIMDLVSQLRGAAAPEGAPYATGAPAAPTMAPQLPAGQAIQGSAPNFADALAMFQGGGGAPRTLEYPNPERAAPAAAPQASPSAPAAPNNLDARDLGAGSRGPVMGTAPISAPPTPAAPAVAMPQFSGSPKEVARARNEWMMDQAKARAVVNGKINLAGGRESVFINRVVNSGNQAAADLENVVKLPMTASRGLFGGRSQGKSLFEAGKETLANTMTTQEVQTYNVFATGFQRALAAIEGAGLAPSNALMHQMDAVIFKEGDTNFTKLAKLAQTRQIVEKGLETVLVNSRVDEGTKRLVEDIVKKVRTAVPFTGSELIQLEAMQQSNPNATLADVMKEAKSGTGGGGVGDIGAQVRSQGIAYEPEKYDYRVVGGKVQRKAK